MAEGMMGRGPAPRGRLSDEQRAQIRQVRMDEGRGAARKMRRNLRREAGLPVMQRPMRQQSINELQDRMSEMEQAPQSPMVMGQPTEDMMAFRPMPTEQPGNMQGFDYRPLPPMPSGNPFPQGQTQGVAQSLGAALGDLQQRPLPITDMMYRPSIHGALGEMNASKNPYVRDPGFQMNAAQEQAMRDRYAQMQGQRMPGMNPNFGPMPSLRVPMQQPMQQEPGYYGSIRRMMETGRMDANHPAAQTVRGYDRGKAMQMFAQKQAQNAMNPGFRPSLAGARFY